MQIKKYGLPDDSPFFLCKSETILTLRFETIAAIHGTISAGLKRNLSLTSAAVTDDSEHLAGSTAVAVLSLAGVTAGLAPAGFVLETLFGVEFLFAGGENKFVATITAGQSFVFVHGSYPPNNVVLPAPLVLNRAPFHTMVMSNNHRGNEP